MVAVGSTALPSGYDPGNTATSPLGTQYNAPSSASQTVDANGNAGPGTGVFANSKIAGTTPPQQQLVMLPDGQLGTPAQLVQYNQEVAAIQGPTQAPGADMSGYITAFNNSYNDQMANIKASLQQSMGELGNRRDIAAGIAAKFPQAVASNYADVTNAAAAPVDVSGLSAAAQKAAAPALAHDASVGKANVAAAKGDQGYENMGIASEYGSGANALSSAANTSEASAAAARDANVNALAMQQLGFQDQYSLARQTAANQFNESQIAQQTQPSGIPGMTVAQYNTAVADPTYQRSVTSLTQMMNNPQSFTYASFHQALNTLSPQQQQVFNALYPKAAAMTSTMFGNSTPGTPGGPMPNLPYSTGFSGWGSDIAQGWQDYLHGS